MKGTKRKTLSMFVIAALMAVCAPALAEIVSVDLALTPPTAQTNTLDATVTCSYTYMGVDFTESGSDSGTLSGNLLADLSIDFDPHTLITDVVGLEFTGGRFAATDMSCVVDFSVMGSIVMDMSAVGGTSDTPSPPGSVSGNVYPANQHEVIFNEGTVDMYGTGLVGSLMTPATVDLTIDSIISSANENGTIVLSSPTVIDDLATYDVTITLPVHIDQVFYDNGTVAMWCTETGIIEASGQFTIPEPATMMLLGMGGCALVRRRRL